MLYRLAILENTNHHWVVYKIRYQRLKDRMTVDHFVGDVLGVRNTLGDAAELANEIYKLLKRIEFQQQIIDDKNEDNQIKLQSRAAMTALLRDLTVLTQVKHP